MPSITESKLPNEVNVKSRALRAAALASSLSIGIFLIARANSGCSSETQGVAQPEAPLPPSPSGAASGTIEPAAATVEEHFFQGSKAPGGEGLRPPAPAASSVQTEEEFIGGSKSGRLLRSKPSSQQNAPNPPSPGQQ